MANHTFLKRFLRFGFTIILLSLLAWLIDLEKLGESIIQVGLGAFAFCVLLDLTFYGVETIRIYLLSGRRYSIGAIWRSRLFSVFSGNFLPGYSSSEVVRLLVLDRERPGNKLYVLLLLLANRMYGLIALAGLFLLAFVISPASLPGPLVEFSTIIILGCALVVIAPMILHIRKIRWVLAGLVRRLRGRWRKFARIQYVAMVGFANPKQWAIAITSSMITNLFIVIIFWIIGNSVGAEISFFLWMICVPIITVATFLPVGVGAIGTQEAAMAILGGLLEHPLEPLIAVSVMIHLIRILGSVPGAFYGNEIKKMAGKLN